MGITVLPVTVNGVGRRVAGAAVEMVVDSGAIYSIVPGEVLRRVGVHPYAREQFRLADGGSLTRDVAVAMFEIEGRLGGAPVIFGIDDDAAVLGVLSLEAVGLSLDPFRRRLRPLRLTA